ncbi:MAG: hypothetical protein IKI75_02420 [Lachnospiraceae bacterium]|nr:hypothetical protein [Lachnospiraceae bacterium]
MSASVMTAYNGLNAEYRSLVDDFITMLAVRQNEENETLKVIEDARNGIGLSKGYVGIDELMEDLNADD